MNDLDYDRTNNMKEMVGEDPNLKDTFNFKKKC